jgi:hypothetical protein
MPADHRNSPVGRNSFRSALQAKSRRRREDLTKLAAAAPGSHGARNDLLPRLEMVDVAPADLRLPTRKVRRIEGSHVREVANAISGLGFCDPVLIDEGNVVLDGIVRAEAAKVLGLHRIPCIRASHLSVSERRLVRLALNRLSEKGTWDIDELKLELEELLSTASCCATTLRRP